MDGPSPETDETSARTRPLSVGGRTGPQPGRRFGPTVRGLVRALVLGTAVIGGASAAIIVATAATAAPAGAAITGIDVASYQHPRGVAIDWRRVAAAGHRFAYVKATESTTYTNPYFAADWVGAASAGLYRGAYHYARPAWPLSSAEAQARYFVSVTGSATGPQDLPLELDLEETGGLGQADLAEWARRFLAEVTRLTGKRPLVYTGRWFWQGSIGAFGNDIGQTYRLWTADYHCQRYDGSLWCDPETDTYNPPIYGGWGQWTFWQNYSVGSVPGIEGNVDMNRFCCDLGSLAALAGGGGAGGSPFGSFDAATMVDAATVAVSGWAMDPDTREPIPVHVYVDGAGYSITADLSRPDVGAAFPGFGDRHGFAAVLPVPLGARQVCAYGINTASGVNTLLGCRSLGGDPFGVIDVASSAGPGRVQVSGWSIDPNGATPTSVTIRVGGVDTVVTADRPRADLVGFGQGPAHGWSAEVTVSTGGSLPVCVTTANSVGPGSAVGLGCRTVVVPAGAPIGVLEAATGRPGTVVISGWSIDPDVATSIDVLLVLDGGGTPVRADRSRADLATAFPGYGASHGFEATLPASAGVHQVCAWAINVGVGQNSLLGCRGLLVPRSDPFGSLDAVVGGAGSVAVAGWAIDADTNAPIPIHVYVDGVGSGATANGSRPDVAAVFPAFGPDHGYLVAVPAAPGPRSVCVYAINIFGPGANQLLGCRTVTVRPADPIGAFDVVARVGTDLRVAGWALDPETMDAIDVHVYVNGVGSSIRAAGDRPDVARAVGLGPAHGFEVVRPAVGAGAQTVCVHAINVGIGANVLLGCRTIA